MKQYLRLLNTAAIAALLVATLFASASTQAADSWDLGRDWALEGKTLAGIPFGPDIAWGVYSVQFDPEWKWTVFNRAMHFTVSNPWCYLYNIDGWWLGGTPKARIPMVGQQMDGGNVPGLAYGSNYDWPEGRVAACTWPDNKGKGIMTTIAWTAPRAMTVNVSGGVWPAGQFGDIAKRRTRVRMWIDRAANGIGAPDEVVFADYLVPLWTEGCNSDKPCAFADILGAQTQKLQKIAVSNGDRIAIGFYWDETAENYGLSGIDFRVGR
ncbi:MAG: hypothetical protein HYX78_07645 [Armatimonadetes bacterium]|nr:hypothetical protein [Armatimonadota bacterium]